MDAVFRYANPPAIHWGPGSVGGLRRELERLGVRAVGLVSTRSVVGDSRLLQMIEVALGGPPAQTSVIGQHAPQAEVERAAGDMGAAQVEALVSVGGGSPIDAAKIVSVRLRLPHLAVPTTLSAAELAAGAGLTDEAGNKVGLRDPAGLPAAVFYDELLAVRTPLELWLATGMRALDHAVEGYLAADPNPLTDHLCLEAVRQLFAGLPEARRRPDEAAVRGRNQVAAWFSYLLPAASAGGLSHVLGKQIGARHGIPHGVTSCLLLPHVLRYRALRQPERAASLAAAAGAEDCARAVADLVQELQLPHRLGAFGLSRGQLAEAAAGAAAAFDGAYPPADLLAIYEAAL